MNLVLVRNVRLLKFTEVKCIRQRTESRWIITIQDALCYVKLLPLIEMAKFKQVLFPKETVRLHLSLTEIKIT